MRAVGRTMGLYLPVLFGTVRDDNRSRAVAEYVTRLLGERGVETRLVDPATLPFGELKRREWEMDPRPAEVDAFVRDMGRADGFVIVSPEYNWGYPGALKDLIDHLYDEWSRKPFALVGVGGVSGGLRMIDQLRQVVSGVEAIPIPAHVPVQAVAKSFGPHGPLEDEPRWRARFGKMFDELEWYARALKAAREADPVKTA
jgi:NAD(P)H-dependent FMN reductase